MSSLLSVLLGLVGTLPSTAQVAVPAPHHRYPASPFVVDVTQPPYSAKGDGVADDTDALQRALNENVGLHKALYFPKGTYLVSRTLTWPKKWNGRDNWGKTMLRGEQRDLTTIRLKDGSFTNAAKPEAIMWCGGFGSADWFHNYVENLSFDVGAQNPGAIALQFYSNNSGAVRDCRFVASEGSGAVGLDLGHRDMNGPLLVRNCEVIGFHVGISSARAVNGQTFEHITLRGQRRVGFRNEGQAISIRGLTSDNAVPAVSTYGTLCLIDAKLVGHAEAAKAPAIVNFNGGRIFLRDTKTTGYSRALADMKTPDFAAAYRIRGADKPGSEGPDIAEYCSQLPTSPFPSPTHSLRLPVKETPEVPWDDPQTWANVDTFGADPTAKADSAAAIQRAMDSGARAQRCHTSAPPIPSTILNEGGPPSARCEIQSALTFERASADADSDAPLRIQRPRNTQRARPPATPACHAGCFRSRQFGRPPAVATSGARSRRWVALRLQRRLPSPRVHRVVEHLWGLPEPTMTGARNSVTGTPVSRSTAPVSCRERRCSDSDESGSPKPPR
jgi:hypothetical protein